MEVKYLLIIFTITLITDAGKTAFSLSETNCVGGSTITLINRSTEISFQGSTKRTECSWNIPRPSASQNYLSIFKVNEVKLSGRNTAGIRFLKFPGQGYRYAKPGECVIAYDEERKNCNIQKAINLHKSKCQDTVIRKVSEEDIWKFSYQADANTANSAGFKITHTYEDISCNDTTKSKLDWITSSDNNTNPNDFMPMANANRTFDDDEDYSDDEPSTLLEFIIVATLPVVIAVVAGVYCLVRRRRLKSASENGSNFGGISDTQDSNVSRGRGLNQYVETGYFVEYESQPQNVYVGEYGTQPQNLDIGVYGSQPQGTDIGVYESQPQSADIGVYGSQPQNVYIGEFGTQSQSADVGVYGSPPENLPINDFENPAIIEGVLQHRNSFTSSEDSFDPDDDDMYSYDNEVTVPEKNGYLVPVDKDKEGYLVPMDSNDIDNNELDDDAFGDVENPYETIQEIYYRSASYSED